MVIHLVSPRRSKSNTVYCLHFAASRRIFATMSLVNLPVTKTKNIIHCVTKLLSNQLQMIPKNDMTLRKGRGNWCCSFGEHNTHLYYFVSIETLAIWSHWGYNVRLHKLMGLFRYFSRVRERFIASIHIIVLLNRVPLFN